MGTPTGRPRHSYGQAALDSEANDLECAPTGGRHRSLFIASLKIGSLVGGGEINRENAERRLLTLGRSLGLPESDVRRQVTRGLDKGEHNPRRAPATIPETPGDHYTAAMAWIEWYNELPAENFDGTQGSTLLRLLAAFALAGVAHPTPWDLGLSHHQAAEAAGLSRVTVSKLLKPGGPARRYLSSTAAPRPHQWLRGANTPPASRWRPIRRLSPKRAFVGQPIGQDVRGLPDCREKARLGLDPADNVWHRRSNAWRLAGLLADDEEHTVAELAEAMGVARVTVRRSLAYLAEVGIAERVDRWSWRSVATSANAPEIAPDGIDHAGLRRTRHARERAVWADYVARRLAELAEALAKADEEFEAQAPRLPGMSERTAA